MKFSKLAWLGVVRHLRDIPAVQRLAILDIGDTSDKNGNEAWKSNKRVMDELGVSLDTVKRARRAAIDYGLWVVTKPGRACGKGDDKETTHYRLTMPAVGASAAPSNDETEVLNGCSTAPIKDDLTGAVDGVNGCYRAPLMGAEIAPSSGISSGTSSGESRAREEPLDVTAVPESSDALSQDQLLETNVIYGEVVELDDDPEPQYGCDEHPLGHGKPCPACGIARHHYNRWHERHADRIVAQLFNIPEPPPPEPVWRPRCPWCQDTGLVLMSDGEVGSPPMWCPHELYGRRPATDEEIAEYHRRTA
ncbi:helix-turn-helix domain-containing protein [Mycobacteroides chelonae]|uniref:helix-turn-helix domain-containing protein n=1 Tax=Mycobacteroides chelonae TaxID=1774 RepID=UPI0010425FF8|nr:helix-turn-helix domain-containing protein [Mycobacteroides chelonae]